MKSHDQSGFAVVEILLVTIILAIVGGTGYFVWHARENTNESLTNTSNSQPGIVKKTTTKTHTVTTKDTATYLTIKEWGVKFKLTDELAGAYYMPIDGNSSSMNLSTDVFKGTSCAADATSEGAIHRYTADSKDSLSGLAETQIYGTNIKVGDYYYAFVHPQAACTNDTTLQSKASATVVAFKAAIDSLQTAN